MPAAGRERSKRKKITRNPAAPETRSRNPLRQQPGDVDHLETTCDKTRSTRSCIYARFHRSRVGANRPHTALAINENHERYTDGQTHRNRQTGRQTDRLIKYGTLYAPRGEELFLPYRQEVASFSH